METIPILLILLKSIDQTVTWYNGDTISHTVTSGQDGDEDEGSLFDSDAIIPNQHYSVTLMNQGNIITIVYITLPWLEK